MYLDLDIANIIMEPIIWGLSQQNCDQWMPFAPFG